MSVQWAIIIGFFACVLWFLQNRLYKALGLLKIEYTRFFNVPAAYAGDEIQMVEVIANRKLLFAPWIELESNIDPSLQFHRESSHDIKHGQFHRSVFTMLPYMRITRRHRVRCTKRGCYFLNSAAINCCDLLGFQVSSREVSLSVRLFVYPKILSMQEIPLPAHSWQGDVTVRRWIVEDPFMISGTRGYQSGDPLSHINWKATARTGVLQVHKREYTANPELMIYLNFDMSDDMWNAVTDPECVELGITYAASLAYHTISKGIKTGFGCNGCQIDPETQSLRILPGSGEDHFTFMMENMARLVIKRSVTFYTFLEQDIERGLHDSDIVIITSYMSDRLAEQIERLKELGNAVEILWLEPDYKRREEGFHAAAL